MSCPDAPTATIVNSAIAANSAIAEQLDQFSKPFPLRIFPLL